VTEFKRLLESSPNAATRELLRAGLPDGPVPNTRQRVAVALGLGAATGAAASSGAAAGTAGATALSTTAATAKVNVVAVAAKWLVGGLALGGALAGGAVVAENRLSAPAPVHSASASSDSRAGVAADNGRGAALDSTPPAADPRDESTASDHAVISTKDGKATQPAPTRAGEAAARAAAPATHAGARSVERAPLPPQAAAASVASLPARQAPLGAEVALIDAARRAVAADDANTAMAELDRYDSVRETRILDREARLLRIEALLVRGEGARAGALAREYLRDFPTDPRSGRLRELAAR
jgi:hypothetical protein